MPAGKDEKQEWKNQERGVTKMVSMPNMILEHTFDAYAKRMNKPKVFFSGNDAKTVEHTEMNWGAENDRLKNRVRRVNLEEA